MRQTPVLLMLFMLLVGCSTAPVTGRQQLILVSDDQLAEQGRLAYQQILTEKGTSTDANLNATVQRVGERIVAAADVPAWNWRFAVINDSTPNAFALPGGYVGVNSGLFQVVENEDQLAAVIGHEIGHVAARHHAERVSRQALVDTGVSTVAGDSGLASVLAAGATLGLVLPFSRDQESEADAIGLRYMAEAAYDPRAAVQVWRNFQRLGDSGGPQFLATHPAPEDRIKRLEALLPEAMAIYESRRG
ncbi:MAG: M48 family metallopeptidase [Dongiaceae bacterium]